MASSGGGGVEETAKEEQIAELEAVAACLDLNMDAAERNVTWENRPGHSVFGTILIRFEALKAPVTVFANGSNGRKTAKIDVLAAVSMHFELPFDYPALSAPILRLECPWMYEKTMNRLSKLLKEKCEENAGMPVLFFCSQAIADEAWNPDEYKDETGEPVIALDITPYASSYNLTGFELLKRLIASNEVDEQDLFVNKSFECEVCFDERLGRDCVRFEPCRHVFCASCTRSYFMQRLYGATVSALQCLEEKCESNASQAQVKQVVGEAEYERYERLLLERALGQMHDVVMCPRQGCQKPVVLSSSNVNLGRCEVCEFTFCRLCRNTYHGLDECKFNRADRAKFLDEWNKAKREGSYAEAVMARKYGGEAQLKRLIQAFENEEWIDENSKRCPNCRTSIEKNSGCNKMHCTKCDVCFCWLCGAVLDPQDPYKHYNVKGAGGCFNLLFEGVDESDDEEWIDGEDNEDDEEQVVLDEGILVDIQEQLAANQLDGNVVVDIHGLLEEIRRRRMHLNEPGPNRP